MTETTLYFLLKRGDAPKTGLQAKGKISYAILTDAKKAEIFIALTANANAGGAFSREAVALAKLERCLAGKKPGEAFSGRQLRSAFVGRSANNGGFAAAVLRAEGLLAPAPDAPSQHAKAGDWAAWLKQMLALPTTPFVFEEATTPSVQTVQAAAPSNAVQPKKPAAQPVKPEVPRARTS